MAKPRLGVQNADVLNIGTPHEDFSSFYKMPTQRISLLKDPLNVVLQVSGHDGGRRSKHLRQYRGQIRVGQNVPSRVAAHDRRPQAEHHSTDPGFADGIRTHRAGLNGRIERAIVKAGRAKLLLG